MADRVLTCASYPLAIWARGHFDGLVPSRVLVTGQLGLVGRYLVRELEHEGHSVVGFDIQNGHDVRDSAALATAMSGCDAVVHLAAADDPLPAEVIVDTTVVGTKNLLDLAVTQRCQRVVIASSVDALGIFMGVAPPDYLPIDDAHPARPSTPYGAAKRAAELLAERVSASTGLVVICLRPPGVCEDETMALIRSRRVERASYEWDPIWEYSAWIHAEDLARALVAACFCPPPLGGYACVLVAASDVNSDAHSGRAIATRLHPTVPWRGGDEYQTDTRRSLIDTTAAGELLGWTPTVLWVDRT